MKLAWLLLRLEARRRFRPLAQAFVRLVPQSMRRQPTARKGRGCLLPLFVAYIGGSTVLGMAYMVFQAMQAFHQEPVLVGPLSFPAYHVIAFGLLGVTLASALGEALQQIAGSQDFEWLCTLPVRRTVLLGVRTAVQAVTAYLNAVLLLPMCWGLALAGGWRLASPLVAVVLAFPLALMGASLALTCGTWARLVLAPKLRRDFQAVLSLGSVIVLIPYLVLVSPQNGWPLLRPFCGPWLETLPPWQAAQAACQPSGSALAALYLEALLALGLATAWASWLMRAGVVNEGSRETARQKGPGRAGGTWLPPILRKDLLIFRRDRSLMVSTLVLPVVMLGVQLLVQAGLSTAILTNPHHAATAVFGLAAFTLLGPSFQVVLAEKPALWLITTLPCKLESILWQKARLVGALGLTYAVGGLVLVGLAGARPGPVTVLLVLVGVLLYTVIGICLGVLATDALTPDPTRVIRQEFLHLFMILVAFYGGALFSADLWSGCVNAALTALVALALAQKVQEALPFLLDPTAGPPARVSLADGLMAAQGFFIFQVVAALMLGAGGIARETVVLAAFLVAGALVYGAVRLVYHFQRTEGVPRFFGRVPASAPLLGLLSGLLGAGYLLLLEHPAVPYPALAVLAVLCAPVFEEFIFRGLIFAGLRRTLPLRPAMLASAVVFAMVHPPIAFPPVLVMGLCAAWCYERTQTLAAPGVVHGVYNAVVLSAEYALS